MRKGCQVPCADTPLALPASVLVRGTSWDSLLCELLIYVLRQHIVLIPPALSPPPACLAPEFQNPLLQSLF